MYLKSEVGCDPIISFRRIISEVINVIIIKTSLERLADNCGPRELLAPDSIRELREKNSKTKAPSSIFISLQQSQKSFVEK